MQPAFGVPEGDTRRDLHRTTVHLSGFGGPRFEELKKALFAVQCEVGSDAIRVQVHRRQPAAEVQ